MIDVCFQGPEWDVEVPEHAQRPRERATGPPQAASGELAHTRYSTTKQTITSVSSDTNVRT